MMFRNSETRRIAPLLTHADAGIYTLPAEVMQLRAEMERLTTHAMPEPTSAAEVAAVAFRSAATTGDGWPDPDELAALHARNQMLGQLARVRVEVLQQIETSLYGAVVGRADVIIVDHLRPVFQSVLADLRSVVDTLDGRPVTGAEILSAPKPVRDAAVAIDDLAARYGVLRDAQSKLAAVTTPSTDDGLYFEMRNPEDFRENRRLNAPWPIDDRVEMLRWMLSHGVDLWMPTPAERDELVESRATVAA